MRKPAHPPKRWREFLIFGIGGLILAMVSLMGLVSGGFGLSESEAAAPICMIGVIAGVVTSMFYAASQCIRLIGWLLAKF